MIKKKRVTKKWKSLSTHCMMEMSTGFLSGKERTMRGSQLITHQLTTRWKLSPSISHQANPSDSSNSV